MSPFVYKYRLSDSVGGLLKHHRLVRNEEYAPLLLKEFLENRSRLIEVQGTRVFEESHLFALRHFRRTEKNKDRYHCNILDIAPTQNFNLLPQTAAWALHFAREHKAKVGWIIVSVLKPKSKIYPHIDTGIYFSTRRRYHLVLKSKGGLMTCGGETEMYKQGEVWLFNNRVPHWVENMSEEERIHLVLDLQPENLLGRARNVVLWLYWGLRKGRLWRYYFGVKFPHF